MASYQRSRTPGTNLGILIALSAATIGVLYGYDIGSIAGALLFLKTAYGLTTFMQELVTSAVGVGAIIGTLTGGRLANRIGRKQAMVSVAVGFAVFAALSAVALGTWWLIVMRFFLGVAIGVSIVTAPVFVAESAPSKIRGSLVVTYQIATTVGIAIAYFVDLAFSYSGNWQWMLGISAIPAAVIILIIARLPDSPRWYMMKGRHDDAMTTLQRIEGRQDVEDEVEQIRVDLSQKEAGTWRELFSPKFAKATLFVLGLGFFVQITGINAIIYYSPTILKMVGFTSTSSSILATAIIQMTSIVVELGSFVVVDRWGRRKTILTGIGTMVVATALMAVLFRHGMFTAGGAGWAFFGILIYHMGYSFGFGSLVWVFASETFPARMRTVGASAMLTMDLLANLVIGLTFLSALQALGGEVVFGSFLVLAFIAWLFVYRLAPETKGRSLEDIRDYWDNDGKWPSIAGSEVGSK